MQTPKLLSIPAAATFLGISRPTLFRRLRDGSIPSIQLGPRRYIPAAALEALIASASNDGRAVV